APYCFEAKSWKRAVSYVIQATTVFRQSDNEFVQMLNDIRVGKLTDKHVHTLDKLMKNTIDTSDGILPTLIYTTTENVRSINHKHFEELKQIPFTFPTNDKFIKCDTRTKTKLQALLDQRCAVTLDLKIGTQVILTRNISVSSGLVNGSRGVVTGFEL